MRSSASAGPQDPGVHRERGPRYERSRPDELWHIDIKGPFWLQRAPGVHTKVWIAGLVDDDSRFLIGLRVLPRPCTEPILEWLRDCEPLPTPEAAGRALMRSALFYDSHRATVSELRGVTDDLARPAAMTRPTGQFAGLPLWEP